MNSSAYSVSLGNFLMSFTASVTQRLSVTDSMNRSELGNWCIFLDMFLWYEQPSGSSHSQNLSNRSHRSTASVGSHKDWAVSNTTKHNENKSPTAALKQPASNSLNSVALERSLQHQAIIVKCQRRQAVMAGRQQYDAHRVFKQCFLWCRHTEFTMIMSVWRGDNSLSYFIFAFAHQLCIFVVLISHPIKIITHRHLMHFIILFVAKIRNYSFTCK